jgi:hypothetical protein
MAISSAGTVAVRKAAVRTKMVYRGQRAQGPKAIMVPCGEREYAGGELEGAWRAK